eukprot:TRINITY_DN4018_c0_g2_i2.p5 TRINITY_DN4018_c0_g2~~TRINITY_DN4018_c0_g2_i2.p5  ORF type:complete len:112 (+),score=38.03 TRINITY_DN4018_c0_g2_i2:209-544(+)
MADDAAADGMAVEVDEGVQKKVLPARSNRGSRLASLLETQSAGESNARQLLQHDELKELWEQSDDEDDFFDDSSGMFSPPHLLLFFASPASCFSCFLFLPFLVSPPYCSRF